MRHRTNSSTPELIRADDAGGERFNAAGRRAAEHDIRDRCGCAAQGRQRKSYPVVERPDARIVRAGGKANPTQSQLIGET